MRRALVSRALLLGVCCMASSLCLAAGSGAPRRGSDPVGVTVAEQPSAYFRFETHLLASADGRRHYKIQLAIPRHHAPGVTYPVLYMLDGNAAMDSLTREDLAVLARHGSAVLVAVGHDVPTRTDAVARAYDYTPPVYGRSGAPAHPVVLGHVGGGADVFLDLLADRILPLVRQRAPVDDARSVLWGHSYGGLFVLYALMQRPGLFQRYFAGDPSVWWRNGALQAHWRALDKARLAGAQLSILVGTQARTRPAPFEVEAAAHPERPSIDPQAVLMEMVGGMAAQGVRLLFETFPQYGHGEMLRCSLQAALDALIPPTPP